MELEILGKNYYPGTMSFADGFAGPKGNVGYFMVVDYKKAKNIIKELLKTREIDTVSMGLDGDWDCNSNIIYDEGEYSSYECNPQSCWAKPIIIVNYKNSPSEAYEVWKKGKLLTK